MPLFLNKIVKGIAKAIEEMEKQQADQLARQKAQRQAALERRAVARKQKAGKPPPAAVPAQPEHSRIESYTDKNIFDEYVHDHHDPSDEIVDQVDLSEIQSKSSFESDRTHQDPIAPDAFKLLLLPHGPRNAFILSEIFKRPEHRWE